MKALIICIAIIAIIVSAGFLLFCKAAGKFDDREFGGYEKEEEEKDE